MQVRRCHVNLKVFSPSNNKIETLKDFVARFKEAILDIYHLDKSVAMLALKKELYPSRFTNSLDKTFLSLIRKC